MGETRIRIFHALSYSRTLGKYLTGRAEQWQVYSVHAHACNLRTVRGELITLVSPQHGNGPFHIVVPQAALADLLPASVITITSQQLIGSGWQITLQNANSWEPRLEGAAHFGRAPHLNKLLQPYPDQLNQRLREANLPSWGLIERLVENSNQIATGLKARDANVVASGAAQLLGLGPGLTPLGDDWLIGILGGLYLLVAPHERTELLVGFAQGLAAQRTTHISWLWLQHAVHGEFGETWHQLGAALADQSSQAIDQALLRIAASGATSGLAALCGLAACCQHLPGNAQKLTTL